MPCEPPPRLRTPVVALFGLAAATTLYLAIAARGVALEWAAIQAGGWLLLAGIAWKWPRLALALALGFVAATIVAAFQPVLGLAWHDRCGDDVDCEARVAHARAIEALAITSTFAGAAALLLALGAGIAALLRARPLVDRDH